jgi:hypothetical protein
MILLVETLKDNLSQEIRYEGEDRLSMAAFIPYLYCHNVSGTFTFQVLNGSDILVSESFTVEDIKESLGSASNYLHVFYPIIPTNPVQIENGNYTFKLIAPEGYVPSQGSFMGWIKQFENIQNSMDYNRSSDSQNTFAIRFKSYKEGINV